MSSNHFTRGRRLSRHCLLFAAIVIALARTIAQTPFSPPSPCSSVQRFDVSSLSCINCGTYRYSDLTGRLCVCAPGERKTITSGSIHSFTCSACASSVSSRDSSSCMVCDASTGATLNANTSDCACPAATATFGGYRLEESDALGVLYSSGKRCVACPPNGRVSSTNAYHCRLCPHANQTMDSNGICTCNSPYVAAGPSCVLATEAAAIGPGGTVMSYSAIKASDDGSAYSLSLNSDTLLNSYMLAAANCQFYQDETACETLGNICVLQKYSADSAACRLFSSIAATRTLGVRGFTGWQTGMPFLKYNDDTVRSSAYLQSQYSLSSQPFSSARLVVSNLKFVLAKYRFNGTFLGFEDLVGQFQLCGGSNTSVSRFLRFGSTFENTCKFSLPQIVSWPETVFYDLYIVDTNSYLFPVPIEVVNYKGPISGGSTQLFGRFFIYDNIAAKSSASSAPSVITYAKSIKLSVSLQSGSSSTIYPPVLTIEYADREVSSFAFNRDANTQSRVSFSAEYTRDLSGFWLAAVVLLAMSVVVIVILWFGKIYRFQKLNMVEQIDLLWLARAGVFALAVLSEVFYWLIFILTAYCWLFFKGQSTAYFLLPERSSSAVSTLSTFVALCFFAKLIDVLHKVWNQIHADIYFVDWEKPRGYLPRIIHKDDMAQVQDTALPVSVWRKLFITNRWNELQTARAVSSEVTLFGLLFFLRGIGLEYLQTSQPAATDLSSDSAPIHPILRYCVTTFFWIGIAGAQLVFRRFVYNRYVEDKAAQFVDLLSFTNISCLIFDGKYHCYYLHGKSVHTHADASLEELTAQIASEQKSLTRSRGLIDGQDTFEVFVSRLFRARYDKVYRTQLARELRRAAGERRRAQEPRGGTLAQEPAALTRTAGDGDYMQSNVANATEIGNLLSGDKMLQANAQLNEFLIAFIEKNDPQYPWEEGVQSFCERRFDLPPYLERDSPVSMFYPDTNNKFTQSVLMGIEYDLLLLFSLFYACLDLLFSNTFVSILVTYVAERALRGFRFHWGRINVSRKTLVNERFLI